MSKNQPDPSKKSYVKPVIDDYNPVVAHEMCAGGAAIRLIFHSRLLSITQHSAFPEFQHQRRRRRGLGIPPTYKKTGGI
jgi:hypothetical protein